MKKTLWIICFVLLVGCGARGPAYSEMATVELNNKSAIIVFRKDQFVDGGSCYGVRINGKEIGVLANGGFLRVLVEPGQNDILIPHVNDKKLNIAVTAELGKTTYVEYSSLLEDIYIIPVGSFAATNARFHNTLAQVKSEYAISELQNLKDSSGKPSCMATIRE